MAVQVGTGDQLIIYLPNRGQTNWSEDFRTQFAELIAKHDHTGSGKGVKITGQAIDANTVTDGNISFIDLTPTPQTGYSLIWNGSNYVPGAVGADGGISGISAVAQSTIMTLSDSSIVLTTNSGSPANTPGNELDLRINGGKFLLDGSNNSNLLLSSSTGASAADPNTKLYIQLAARSTAFDAADKTTWSDIVISNPTDSASAAAGIRFNVDDADDENEGAGIAAVKLSPTEKSMDLRFITHPATSSTSRQSMRLKDTYDGIEGHETVLTVNDDTFDSNKTRLGLGNDTPTSTIDVKTGESAVITLQNTSETGNLDRSRIEFKNKDNGVDKDWALIGFQGTTESNLYIQTESDNTDGAIVIKTQGEGASADIVIDSHDALNMYADGGSNVTTGGDINIKAGDHTSSDTAHVLIQAGQPAYTTDPEDGSVVIKGSDDVILAADDDIAFITNSTTQLNIRENGNFEYKGDFDDPKDAYFVRAYATVHHNSGDIVSYVSDGFDSFSYSSTGVISVGLISGYPDQEKTVQHGTGTLDHTLTSDSNAGHYTVSCTMTQNMDSNGDWQADGDWTNNGGSVAAYYRRRNSFRYRVANANGVYNTNAGLVDLIVVRR